MKDAQVAYQLRVLFDKKITAYYQDSFKGIFGKVQVEVLNYLYEYREARTQEIAEIMNIPKQHASKILMRLEELNLVESKPDEMDGRARKYGLTEQGVHFMNQHIEESDRNFEELLGRLPLEEKEQLMSSMRTMVEILEKL